MAHSTKFGESPTDETRQKISASNKAAWIRRKAAMATTNPTPTQQGETLLPCPFCGSPTPQIRDQEDGVWIDCYRKGCSVEVLTDCETVEGAAKCWNTRAVVAGLSDSARRAAEEISSTFGLRFQEDSLQRTTAIISKHFAAAPADNDAESRGESDA